MKKIHLLILLLLTANISFAKIWLPSILSDNMVLQQNSNATIWGWTTSTAETIEVIGSWNGEVVKVKAYQGVWSVTLPTIKAGGPYTVTIKGHEEIVLSNVLLGEVWLCSGQSNMQWTPENGLLNAEEEIKKANYPNIRFFQVPQTKSITPQDDLVGDWTECKPETMRKFSSVAYFYGKELYQALNVPIGLINSSWGGTPVEPWIKKELIENDEELKKAAKKLKRYEWWPGLPGSAYNGMIHPITKFNIAGVIWYQGESNRDNAFSYYKSFPLLIEFWRKEWGKEFPFYFTQIAPFNYKSKTNIEAAVVRDAQLYTMLTLPKTGMAVTNDIGNLKNIHPINKQEVSKRLALWALVKTYGVKDLMFSGPVYKSMEIKKNKIVLHFDYAENGLVKKEKELREFFIAGEDQKFYPAIAKIKNNTVVVSSKKVKKPVAVRFAFSDTALPNLYNMSGLPASAFRTDDWKIDINND
ncbi:sialate O-acetylesterase [Jejuia spongiicola]|uniref:Sialate O-acetylesterase n=1 Tax=Jejuia spongiicola TaxID=2942207 RepID=A0ABT0QGL3_9FLAO|nr:sialate O-acetylesterase [Jejuia spongiicola]MCL6296141.1 sialate O-acetylesterase [Jejuia spongiicola]